MFKLLICILIAIQLWLFPSQPALAQVLFDAPKTFTVSQSCNATTSIKRATNPVALKIGDRHQALGENKSFQPSHVLIGLNGSRKWVALSCGSYTDAIAEVPKDQNLNQDQNQNQNQDPIIVDQLPRNQTLKIIGFNVESDDLEDTDPQKVAQDMQGLPPADLWGLSEVASPEAAQIFRNAIAAGSDYESILGTTGTTDRLQIVYNTQRLKLTQPALELREVSGTRKPLVAQFQLQPSGPEFLFMVNHFNRRDAAVREAQAAAVREWATAQSLPIIAAGDYNFDVDPNTKKGNPAFEIFRQDDLFSWIEPDCVTQKNCPQTGTQCNPRFNSILDFTFVTGAAKSWQANSAILFAENDYCLREKLGFSDHRPVVATFEIPSGSS